MTKPRYRQHLFICHGKSCSKNGDPEGAKHFFKEKIKEHGLKREVRACASSCLDLCDHGPNIVVYPEGAWYSHVQASDWEEIFREHVLHGRTVERLKTPPEILANPKLADPKKESGK